LIVNKSLLIKSFETIDLLFANWANLLVICFKTLVAHYYMSTVKNNCVSARIVADNTKFVVSNISTLTFKELNFRFIYMFSHFEMFEDLFDALFDVFVN
jgi:hypothetical protein